MNKGKNSTVIDYIAKKENVPVAEVTKEIQKAIDIAYKSRDTHEKWGKLFGDRKPTPEEFFAVIAENLKG
jgi:hypothetical protein